MSRFLGLLILAAWGWGDPLAQVPFDKQPWETGADSGKKASGSFQSLECMSKSNVHLPTGVTLASVQCRVRGRTQDRVQASEPLPELGVPQYGGLARGEGELGGGQWAEAAVTQESQGQGHNPSCGPLCDGQVPPLPSGEEALPPPKPCGLRKAPPELRASA